MAAMILIWVCFRVLFAKVDSTPMITCQSLLFNQHPAEDTRKLLNI